MYRIMIEYNVAVSVLLKVRLFRETPKMMSFFLEYEPMVFMRNKTKLDLYFREF